MAASLSTPSQMIEADRASAGLGIEVDSLHPGRATVSMTVREDMLNGFAITHGGFVFSLADTAFALACNDGEVPVVAAGADIDFLRPTTAGQRLTATAAERSTAGRSGLYDVTVTDEAGHVVAEFRGRSRRSTSPAAGAAASPSTTADGAASDDAPSLQERNKRIVQRFNREFLQGGDEQVFHDTVAEDFINRSPQDPSNDGPAGAFFFFTKVLRVAFPDLEVRIDDQVAEGDEVVTRKTYRATHRAPFMGVQPTGREVSWTVTDIIRLRDGRYVEHWANADMAGLRGQLTAPVG